MLISEFILAVLKDVSKILNGRDQRYYRNIKHILENKLFGHSKPTDEIQPRFMQEVFNKFKKEVQALVDRKPVSYLPRDCQQPILEIFDSVSKVIVAPQLVQGGKDRKELVAVFQNTLQESQRLSHQNPDIQENTWCYLADQNGRGKLLRKKPGKKWEAIARPVPVFSPPVETVVEVFNQDALEGAKDLIDAGHLDVLVLNPANRFSVGGGVVEGTTALEEDDMRRSDYYLSLSQPNLAKLEQNGRHAGRHKYLEPIPEFGSIYTDRVMILKDKHYQLLPKVFYVSFLALAGYDFGKPDRLDPQEQANLLTAGKIDLAKAKESSKVKIRQIFDVALENKKTSLLLSALSCGAFKLRGDKNGVTARMMSEAFVEVIDEPRYRNKFRRIRFCVLGDSFDIFHRALHGIKHKIPVVRALAPPPLALPSPAAGLVPPVAPFTLPAFGRALPVENKKSENKAAKATDKEQEIFDQLEVDGFFKNVPDNCQQAIKKIAIDFITDPEAGDQYQCCIDAMAKVFLEVQNIKFSAAQGYVEKHLFNPYLRNFVLRPEKKKVEP